MTVCKFCFQDHDEEDSTCPRCGRHPLSEAEDRLDHMVEAASVPSLATLFRAGLQSGLIKPGFQYGGPISQP